MDNNQQFTPEIQKKGMSILKAILIIVITVALGVSLVFAIYTFIVSKQTVSVKKSSSSPWKSKKVAEEAGIIPTKKSDILSVNMSINVKEGSVVFDSLIRSKGFPSSYPPNENLSYEARFVRDGKILNTVYFGALSAVNETIIDGKYSSQATNNAAIPISLLVPWYGSSSEIQILDKKSQKVLATKQLNTAVVELQKEKSFTSQSAAGQDLVKKQE